MARSRQLVFVLDDDLNQVLVDASTTFGQSQAMIVRCAMMLFADLKPEERRAALARYMTRSLPPDAVRKGKGPASSK